MKIQIMGGVHYTFLHYTFDFFVYGVAKSVVKKGTLNYTFLHLSSKNLIFSYYFPISFHEVHFQRQNRDKKYPL